MPEFLKHKNSQEMPGIFPQMTESAVVDEKTLFRVPCTHLNGFAESRRYLLHICILHYVQPSIVRPLVITLVEVHKC